MYDSLPHSGSKKQEKSIKTKEDIKSVLDSVPEMGGLNDKQISNQISNLKAMDSYEEICNHIFTIHHILGAQSKKLLDTRNTLEKFSLGESNKDRKAKAEKAIEDLRELDKKTEKRINFFTTAATKFIEKKYKSKALESSRHFLDYIEDAVINIEKYTDEPISVGEVAPQKNEENIEVITKDILPEPMLETEIPNLGVLTESSQVEESAPETLETNPVVQKTQVLSMVEDVPPIIEPPAVIPGVDGSSTPVSEKTEARKVETGELGELIQDIMSDGKKRIIYYDANSNEYSPEEIGGSIISEKIKLEELEDEKKQAREIEVFMGTLPKIIKPKPIRRRVEEVLVDYVKLLNINKKTMREAAPQQPADQKIPDTYFAEVKTLEELRTKMWELEGADKSRKQWIEDTVAGAVKEIRKPETTTYRRLEILNELKKKDNLPNIGAFKETLLKLLEEEVSKITPKEKPIKTEIPDTYFAGVKSIPELMAKLADKVSSEDLRSIERLALNALALMRTARALKEKDSLIEKIVKDKDFPAEGGFGEALKEILMKELSSWEKRTLEDSNRKKKTPGVKLSTKAGPEPTVAGGVLKTPVAADVLDEEELVEGDEAPRSAVVKKENLPPVVKSEKLKDIKSDYFVGAKGLSDIRNLLESLPEEKIFAIKDIHFDDGTEKRMNPLEILDWIRSKDISIDSAVSNEKIKMSERRKSIDNVILQMERELIDKGGLLQTLKRLFNERYSVKTESTKKPTKPTDDIGGTEAEVLENTPTNKESFSKKRIKENYFEEANIKTIGNVIDLLRGELKNNTFTTEDFKKRYTADQLQNLLIEEGVKISKMFFDGTTKEGMADEINRFHYELPINGNLNNVLSRVLMDNYFDPLFTEENKSEQLNEVDIINSATSLGDLQDLVSNIKQVHNSSGVALEGVSVADSLKKMIFQLRSRSFKDFRMSDMYPIQSKDIETRIGGIFPALPQFPTLAKKIIDLAVVEYNSDTKKIEDVAKMPNLDVLMAFLEGAYAGDKIKGSQKEYTVEEIVKLIQDKRSNVLSLDSEQRKLLINKPRLIALDNLTSGNIGLVSKVRELLVSELSALENTDSSPSASSKPQPAPVLVPTPINIANFKPIIEGKTKFELNGYNKDTIDIPEFRAFITELPNAGEIIKDDTQLKEKYETFVKRREVSEEIQNKLGDIIKKEFGLDFGRTASLLADEYLRTLSHEHPEEIAKFHKTILSYRAAPAVIDDLKREVIPPGTNAKRREELPKEIAERELLVKNLNDYKKSLDKQPFFKLFDVINPAFRSKDSRLEKIKGITLGKIEQLSRDAMEKNTPATAGSKERYGNWKGEVIKRVDDVIENTNRETEGLRRYLNDLNTKSAKQIIQEKEGLVSEMMRDVYTAPLQSEVLKTMLQEKAKSEMIKLLGGKGATVKAVDLINKFKSETGQSIYGFDEDQIDTWTKHVDSQATKEVEEKMKQKIESLGGGEKFDTFVSTISELLAEKEIGTQKDKDEVKKFLVDKIKETIDSAPAGIRKGLLEKALKTALEIKK